MKPGELFIAPRKVAYIRSHWITALLVMLWRSIEDLRQELAGHARSRS